MLISIEGGTLYTPSPGGERSVLILRDRIARVGPVDREALDRLDLHLETLDASGCLVLPGLVDPHAHLTGAAGEQGFATRMPEVPLEDILLAGVTTVVGCLGTDTTCRHLSALLARCRQLDAAGITARMYTGGFPVPPATLTGSVRDDLILIDAVIGLGEVAISDVRSSQPTLDELARLVSEAYVGGMVGGKAGVTHVHVGPGNGKLAPLHALLDRYDLEPASIYPTHIERSEALMDDAVALARRGSFVDIDTVEEDLGIWLKYYLEHGGPPEQLTVSSDAHTKDGSHRKLHGQLVSCVNEHGFRLEQVLPHFTTNVARALKLEGKGRLEAGADADLIVVRKETLEVVHVVAGGRVVVRDRRPLSTPPDRR